MLGGKPPRHGGRLTNPGRERTSPPGSWKQLLTLVVLGSLVIGGVMGFALRMNQQIRGGILRQRAEAITRPDWVPMNDLPEYVPPAFLTVVDPGVESTGRFRGRNEGRTIPRELVRQIHLLGNNLSGEARELVMAPVLQRLTSEEELAELYLNRVELGYEAGIPVYGVYHAAQEYFHKDPRELTLSEAATLAGLLLQPRIRQPADVPGAVGVRRNEVLKAMLENGAITPDDYTAAVGERLGFQPGLAGAPMTRSLPSEADTSVIRLPPQYKPVAEEDSTTQGSR
jgi:membrane peptidoglycan carboxypeptidase